MYRCFKKALHGTCNTLQLHQLAEQLNTLFTGKGIDVRLLTWGNRKPTHIAAQSIKMQNRETGMRFIPPLFEFWAALSKQGEKTELPI